MLSLLLNILLLGGSMVWWSGGGLKLGMPQQIGGGSGGQTAGAAGFEHCERAELDEKKLNEWGCVLFHKACFD